MDNVWLDCSTGHYRTDPLLPGTYRMVVVDVVLDPGANIQGHFLIPAGGPAVDGGVHVMERSSAGTMRVGQRVRARIGTMTPSSATLRCARFMDGQKIRRSTGSHSPRIIRLPR